MRGKGALRLGLTDELPSVDAVAADAFTADSDDAIPLVEDSGTSDGSVDCAVGSEGSSPLVMDACNGKEDRGDAGARMPLSAPRSLAIVEVNR
ncbi:MAG: hypothetical protein AAGC97_03070 [Planctomycetota bacterium]